MKATEVIEIIAEISGCDASDDYARGWDDALREVERRIEIVEEREIQID